MDIGVAQVASRGGMGKATVAFVIVIALLLLGGMAFLAGPALCRVDQGLDLGFRQYLRQWPAESRSVELCRRVILPHPLEQQKFVELPHRRDAPGQGSRGQPGSGGARQIGMQPLAVRRLQRHSAGSQKPRETG